MQTSIRPITTRGIKLTFSLKPTARAWLASIPLALLLTACGGGGKSTTDDERLARYREQTVNWTSCPEELINPEATSPVALATRCAKIIAPINYDDPDQGDLEIAISRVPAMDTAGRRGILLLNPGGPGADGFMWPAILYNLLNGSNPADELGQRQLMLINQYDLIGFSPRGTGYSTVLECESEVELLGVSYAAAHRYVPGNIDNMLRNASNMAQACQQNPLHSAIHTEFTVQDMDLIRHLLQEDKMNYLGYSYGTWLGAWYASRFPERVGRMVLDSNMDFSADGATADLAQGPARERWIDEIVAPYAVRHAAHFGLGTDPAAIRPLLENLVPGLQVSLVLTLSGHSYAASQLDDAMYAILAAREIDQVIRANPAASDAALTEMLKSHTYAPHNPAIAQDVENAAFNLLSRWWTQINEESVGGDTIYMDPSYATYWAVMCNDTRYPDNSEYWISQGNLMAERYPLFATYTTHNLCQFWGPNTTKPGLENLQNAHLMLVQSEYDNATPIEGARNFFNQLPKSQWVYVPGEYSHAIFPYGDRCVDGKVVNYLLGIDSPERETVCPSLPFAQDARTQVSRSGLASTYLNPAEAQAQIEALKDLIHNGTRR